MAAMKTKHAIDLRVPRGIIVKKIKVNQCTTLKETYNIAVK
jgi:hypothetical protein